MTTKEVAYEQLAGMVDHALLQPELTVEEVVAGCRLAVEYRVISVCVKPCDVVRAVELLAGSTTVVGTVVGFPHGSSTTAGKECEVRQAVASGAAEIDMVLNIGWLRSGRFDKVRDDIAAVVTASAPVQVKVILENYYLDNDQKTVGCQLAEQAGAAFVKTSTGFAPSGATLADVRLMRAVVSSRVGVKAAGGIRTLDSFLEFRAAGATRIGASATASILDEFRART